MKIKGLKKIVSLFLQIIILFTLQKYYSQGPIQNPGIINNDSKIVSPEVNTLLRYQDFPDVGFIGGTNINIPIYEIKYDGLSIPISLSYDTKGAKVADIASNVGLGWTLSAGGNLSAEVNDKYDFSGSFQKFITQSAFLGPRSEMAPGGAGFYGQDYKPNDASGMIGNFVNAVNDSSPDYYHISAPGLNDKFYLSKINNQFELKSLDNYKTRLSEPITEIDDFDKFSETFDYTAEVSYIPKKFTVKNENGFSYIFENRVISKSPFGFFSKNKYNPSSWLLSSIQSPLKIKKVNFIYETFSNDYVHSTLSSYQSINTGSVEVSKIINMKPPPSNANLVSSPELEAQNQNKLFINKTQFENSQRLKTIYFPEGSASFIYGDNRMDYDGQVLSQIVIKDVYGKEIKHVDFSYSYFQTTDPDCSGIYNCLRLRLDRVYDSTLKNAYVLSYGGMQPADNQFPPRGSGKTDFLGYYKNNGSVLDMSCKSSCYNWSSTYNNLTDYGSTNKIYFYPNLTRDYFIPFKLSNYIEEAVTGVHDGLPSTRSLIGLLTTIKYPTKGGLKIQYENDDFEYLGANYILGSARIKSMEYFNNSNTSIRKINYSYKNPDQKSSGEICFLIPPSDILRAEVNTGYKNSVIVGYSKVIQEEIGNGKIERNYSNFSSYPDIYEDILPIPNTIAKSNFFKFFRYPGNFIQRMDLRRGKLLSEIIYNNQADIVKKNIFEYYYYEKSNFGTTKTIFEHTGIMPNPTNYYYAKNKFINYQNYLSKQITEDYLNGNIIKSENFYTYDQLNNLLKKQETISSGNNSEVLYNYAMDLNQYSLMNKNILGRPLSVENKKDGKTFSKIETKYDMPPPFQLFPESIVLYNLPDSSINTGIKYDKYDHFGNLLQYTTKEGIPVSLIWGYQNNYLMAKIEGLSYDTMMSQVFGWTSNPEANEGPWFVSYSNSAPTATSQQDILNSLDSFRKHNYVKDSKITTYTHDPLVGITSITSPSGIRENYKYDLDNRLEKVVDNDGNILKEYKYNYQTGTNIVEFYNSEQSQIFIRNTCPSGYTSGRYKYIVPSGNYLSIISQADANQKAIDEISINGQNMANDYLICGPSCPISFFNNISASNTKIYTINGTTRFEVTMTSGILSPGQWNNGASVGVINGSCKPSYPRIINYNEPLSDRVWKINIDTLGNISAKLISGSINGNISFQFDYSN